MQGVTKDKLGTDVIAAIARAKSAFKTDTLRPYEGRELIDPDVTHNHAQLFEVPVGEARLADPQGKKGKRRLVIKVQSERIVAVMFTEDHYKPGSWMRVLGF